MLQNSETLLVQHEEEQQPTVVSKVFSRKTLKWLVSAAAVAGCVAAVYRSYTLDAPAALMNADGDGKVTAYEFAQCLIMCHDSRHIVCNRYTIDGYQDCGNTGMYDNGDAH